MMYHIYLILAHKNPAQVHRLINRLHYQNTTFAIHIDADVDIQPFKEIFGDNEKNIIFLEQRSKTNWGSYGLIEATLNGLNYIIKNLPEANRVTLLSGQDYPIKPVVQINKYLEANTDAIYIDYFSIPSQNWINGGSSRFPNYERISKIMNLFGGGQWWSFPTSAIRILLSILDSYPYFISYFKLTQIPDESFFQTLLLNSEDEYISSNIVNKSLCLVMWDVPYLSSRTFRYGDQGIFAYSKSLFARKFDLAQDENILDAIDNNILYPTVYRKYKKEYTPRTGKNKNEIIGFLTNKLGENSHYWKLKKEAPKHIEPHVFFHTKDEKCGLQQHLNNEKVFFFNDADLRELGYINSIEAEPNLLPGNIHFPLLAFYKQNPNYEYYWLIEDDVLYNGNWKFFFNVFSSFKNRADYISCCVRTRSDNPNWNWWDSFKNIDIHDSVLIKQEIASLNPIFRISNAALSYLDQKLRMGWIGHHEVLIPTLLFNGDFSILDFSGDGRFCFPQHRNKFYTGKISSKDNIISLPSFRYRPIIEKTELKKQLLYHPVKTKST